jgi:hypothetical protein
MAETTIIAVPEDPSVARRVTSYVEWAPIVAGAVTAAAISLILLTFGSAIGLATASPWPDSGLPWWLIAIIAALWVLLVQAGSYALGGYLAGRLRAPVNEMPSAERAFRDGAHGFLVWALGVVISAVLVSWAVGTAVKTGVDAASTVAGTAIAGTGVAAGSLATQPDPLGYNVDRLLRSPSTPPAEPADATATAEPATSAEPETATTDASAPSATSVTESASGREGVGRIFVQAIEDGELAADDRTYLAGFVSQQTGLSQADAEARVDEAFAAIQEAERDAREAAEKARIAGAIGAFLTAAALLVAAAAAAAGAGLGGRHRDENGVLRMFGRERFW